MDNNLQENNKPKPQGSSYNIIIYILHVAMVSTSTYESVGIRLKPSLGSHHSVHPLVNPLILGSLIYVILGKPKHR